MGANIQGYNPDAGLVRPEAACEEARRLTSNTPSNLTQESLEVVVKRVYLLLGKSNEVMIRWRIGLYGSSTELLLLLLYAEHVF